MSLRPSWNWVCWSDPIHRLRNIEVIDLNILKFSTVISQNWGSHPKKMVGYYKINTFLWDFGFGHFETDIFEWIARSSPHVMVSSVCRHFLPVFYRIVQAMCFSLEYPLSASGKLGFWRICLWVKGVVVIYTNVHHSESQRKTRTPGDSK